MSDESYSLDEVSTLKKKLMILKKAVVNLREQKLLDDQRIGQLTNEIERVKNKKQNSAGSSLTDIDNKNSLLSEEVQKLQIQNKTLQDRYDYQCSQIAELSEQNYELIQHLPTPNNLLNEKRLFQRTFEVQQDKLSCLIILRYNILLLPIIQVEFPDKTFQIPVHSITDFAPIANGTQIQFIYKVDNITTQQSFEINAYEKDDISKTTKSFIKNNQIVRPLVTSQMLAPLFKI